MSLIFFNDDRFIPYIFSDQFLIISGSGMTVFLISRMPRTIFSQDLSILGFVQHQLLMQQKPSHHNPISLVSIVHQFIPIFIGSFHHQRFNILNRAFKVMVLNKNRIGHRLFQHLFVSYYGFCLGTRRQNLSYDGKRILMLVYH